MNIYQFSIYIAITFIVIGGIAVFRISANRLKLIDLPNARSMHVLPTPRGAGVVFVCVWFIACAATTFDSHSLIPLLILLASVLVAAVGAFDDFGSVSVSVRLLAHILASVLVVFLLQGLSIIEFGPMLSIHNTVILNVFGIIGLVWMLNLFNFMDGTDGLAAAEGLFVSLAGAFVLFFAGDLVTAKWLFYLAACLVGFLAWNLPPAKVFMGDSGSSFLGFFFGTVMFISHNSGYTTVWFWLILTGCFMVDATYTIATRFSYKQNIFQAHKTHVFQRIAEQYNSHAKVVCVYSGINLCWLLPIAILSTIYDEWAFVWFLVAYTPLVALAYYLGAGRTLLPGKLIR